MSHTASPWHGRNTASRPLTDDDRAARHMLLASLPTSTANASALDGTEAANDQPHITPEMAALAGYTKPTATQRRTSGQSNSAVWRLRYRAGYRAGFRLGLVQRITLACCAYAAGMGTAALLVKLGAVGL